MYCTDVDETSGPHAFLPETHFQLFVKNSDTDLKRLVWLVQAINFLPTPNGEFSYSGSKQVWYGPPGTCFLEDTSGFIGPMCLVINHDDILCRWTVGPGFNPSSN